MTSLQTVPPVTSLLRFAFRHSVVSLRVAGDVTLEDIARIRGALLRRRRDRSVAVSVTFGALDGERVRHGPDFDTDLGALGRLKFPAFSDGRPAAPAPIPPGSAHSSILDRL